VAQSATNASATNERENFFMLPACLEISEGHAGRDEGETLFAARRTLSSEPSLQPDAEKEIERRGENSSERVFVWGASLLFEDALRE
jgi:hypothetical protein